MTLESAVQAILEMGKAEASQILEEARAERERTLSQVRTEAAAALAETEKGAREEAERRRIQGLARAELESRKIVLAAQREALDRGYEGALARLSRLEENAEFLRTWLAANESEWRSGGKGYWNEGAEPVVRKNLGAALGGPR